MNRSNNAYRKCKRCNKSVIGHEIICQDCKSELLSSFEASSDWQMAFEIERATQAAMRYQLDEFNDTEDLLNYEE
jgi:hypothetical protein